MPKGSSSVKRAAGDFSGDGDESDRGGDRDGGNVMAAMAPTHGTELVAMEEVCHSSEEAMALQGTG
jgi:hypothetical protein